MSMSFQPPLHDGGAAGGGGGSGPSLLETTMTQTEDSYLCELGPELAVLLGEELFAGNRIREVSFARGPQGMRVELSKPFLVRHRVLPFGVTLHVGRMGGVEWEEYRSTRGDQVLVAGEGPGVARDS